MVLDSLKKDLPAQFLGKRNIDAICTAFDNQLAEIFNVFNDLQYGRSLDTAVGKQLDMAGSIVGLTRAEGALLCGKEIFFEVLDDDRYRSYLKYKAYKNANNCTYEDVINQLRTVLGDNDFSYSEDMSYPATILLSLNMNADGSVSLVNVPTISPAGVSVLYKNKISTTVNVGAEVKERARARTMYCGTFLCGTRP